MNNPIFTAIDLFAGCGGLSTGLSNAGFDVCAAVELDATATTTYRANHPSTMLIQRDILKVNASELLSHCDGEPVALLAGCAPCQGFCSLTSKNKREDPRNMLVLRMVEIIDEVRPIAVMMENVPGLEKRGAVIFQEFTNKLKSIGYQVEWRVIQMADYGIPQSRRRLVLVAGLGFNIGFPMTTHAKNPVSKLNQLQWLSLRDVISEMPNPVTLKESWKGGGPRKYGWHVVSDLQPQIIKRLEQAVPGKTWLGTDEGMRPNCHKNGYRGFTNTYGRMSWDQTPVTMTGGCTTPCKGRFGHPEKQRTTISVREAALIQTFPLNYKFETDHLSYACEMIGNAVPPKFAEIMGGHIRNILQDRCETIDQ